MSKIKTLPLIQDAKFIVIDEGTNAMHGNNIVSGWMHMWKNSGSPRQVDYLLFSDPKFRYDYLVDLFGNDYLKIHDYYTQDINNIFDDKNIDLELIMKKLTSSSDTIVVVNCLNSLILTVGLSKAVRFVEKLSSHVSQLICIYQSNFGTNKVPNIETMGTTYLKLNKTNYSTVDNDICYDVSMIHRKHSGGIIKNHVRITQDISTYEIKSEKEPVVTQNNTSSNTTIIENTVKPETSFRTDLSVGEIEQRNQTPLPYIKNNISNESKIFYVPDCIDDLDEEDPDDDLPF
ncbi:hypothetical protein HCN44_010278 [Aphidius gifuensis]|uniref:Elongator complex protein 5 n=1 Tax=Aphidius gifuensis TaxID=684658 RepID=A0A834XWA9_APHGI|nr:uncharacterized protein LOC122851886 [Aphidius gifuensis]KAF7993683.1 hypothetical protein HCN44_010278 [Aphidius gifuensis]